MSKNDPIEALENIKPKTMAAQIRPLLLVIEKKISDGVRISDITKALNDSGIQISEGTLKTYLYRFRKKQAQDRTEKSTPSVSEDVPISPIPPKSEAQKFTSSPVSPAALESLMKPDPQTQADDLARYERLAKQQRRSRKK
ncbi:TPA: hypothetical protein ACXHSK_005231 [Klebsiella pneumoniae]